MEYQLLTPRFPVNAKNVVEQVFANRGFTLEEMNHYFNTTEQDIIDPEQLTNIVRGAIMLLSHLKNDDKIFIMVDSDCDGYTSAAALINYLNMLFPGHVQNNIQYKLHPGKQHGITANIVPLDIKLVIVPDAGSSDYEEHEKLYNRGCDVLILDHHEASYFSNYACVINNQLCNYPTKSLSGVGIVYKFCSYLDKIMNTNYAKDILDLVALGIIADVMSLKDFETHQLITYGLNHIRNPFFSEMINKQAYSLGKELTPTGVAFYIAPYVNATTRMGTMDDKILLFESMLDFRAYESIKSTKRGCKGQYETRVEQACRNCSNIKNRQTKARDTSLDIIEQIIEEQKLYNDPIMIIQLENPVDKNLTGLIANEIMGKYQRPVLLLNKILQVNDDTGEILYFAWSGSGRNSQYSTLTDLRGFLEESGLVVFAQGHAGAFGCEVLDENISKLKQYISQKLANQNLGIKYYVDFIWPYKGISQHNQDVLDLASYASIWGKDIEEPYIVIENIAITKDNLTLMSADKNPTLKISCDNDLTLIKFRSSKEEFEALAPKSDLGCVIITIIGTCARNIWMGKITPQIQIKDYQILTELDYYF